MVTMAVVTVAVTMIVVMSVTVMPVVVMVTVIVVDGGQLGQADYRQDYSCQQVQRRRVVEEVVKVDAVQPSGDERGRRGQYEPGG